MPAIWTYTYLCHGFNILSLTITTFARAILLCRLSLFVGCIRVFFIFCVSGCRVVTSPYSFLVPALRPSDPSFYHSPHHLKPFHFFFWRFPPVVKQTSLHYLLLEVHSLTLLSLLNPVFLRGQISGWPSEA